ncbi:hypothetical protein [Streptomyces lydicus]|uniref:hypothetical protein n=1 Tax=Streptomyces lydicus TaxID=47763 RepID=UPI0036E16E4B
MSRARYAFAAHPEALADLRSVPEDIRDLALLELQHLVHGNERGAALHRELAGCHKIYVDPETRWRLVIQYRDAPVFVMNSSHVSGTLLSHELPGEDEGDVHRTSQVAVSDQAENRSPFVTFEPAARRRPSGAGVGLFGFRGVANFRSSRRIEMNTVVSVWATRPTAFFVKESDR